MYVVLHVCVLVCERARFVRARACACVCLCGLRWPFSLSQVNQIAVDVGLVILLCGYVLGVNDI